MKRTLLILFFLIYNFAYSQSQITVFKSGTQTPISGAQVKCNQTNLGKTNGEGQLQFKTRCKKVEVSAQGFISDKVVVDKVMEITLSEDDPNVKVIDELILKDKSDPLALLILDKVNANYAKNSPKNLSSYSFKSYDKISYDFDEDSIASYQTYLNKRLDSLRKVPNKSPITTKKNKDSLEQVNFTKLVGESKMFLWERAQEIIYSKTYGEKINVLDNRVSGLKEPLYEMMALRSNRNKIPKEVLKENRNLYRYFLSDSIDIDGRKNYVIRFRQVDYKESVQKKKYNGYLYIDAETYAIKKIESNSKIKSEGTITSIWIPIENHWFLSKENLKIKAGNFNFKEEKSKDSIKLQKKFGTYVFLSSEYFDFKTPVELKRKDFSGYSIDIKNADGSLLNQFRRDPLTLREQNTYVAIDSVGAKYKIDQKASVVSALMKGKIRYGNVDLDVGQFVKYNLYEGLRLGAAAKLNERFHKYFSPDGYIGYGFKSRQFQYGIGFDLKTTTRKNSFFRVEYRDDVMASGKFPENMWNFRMKLMNGGVDMRNDQFYSYRGFKFSYENDLWNTLTMKIGARKDHEESTFNYDFRGLGNQFENFAAFLTLKYSPNTKNMMTPSGKFIYEQNFPEFFLNYEKAFTELDGDFNYHRLDVLATHQVKWSAGVTGIRAYAGVLSGRAPIWHHFQQNGLGKGQLNSLNFNLTSYLGFATMPAGKYYNDKFVGYYFTHRLPWYFKSFGKNTSSFDFIYRGIIGNMNYKADHIYNFEELDHLYQEVGLEWNNFLSTQFNLGFFYRVGYYNTAVFKDNFAIQFKFKFLGF